jgi:hypothetical protein
MKTIYLVIFLGVAIGMGIGSYIGFQIADDYPVHNNTAFWRGWLFTYLTVFFASGLAASVVLRWFIHHKKR